MCRLQFQVLVAMAAVAAPRARARKLLGFSFTLGADIKRRLAPQTLTLFKARVRELTAH